MRCERYAIIGQNELKTDTHGEVKKRDNSKLIVVNFTCSLCSTLCECLLGVHMYATDEYDDESKGISDREQPVATCHTQQTLNEPLVIMCANMFLRNITAVKWCTPKGKYPFKNLTHNRTQAPTDST